MPFSRHSWSRQAFAAVFAVLLGLSLAACGSKSVLSSAPSEDDVAAVHAGDAGTTVFAPPPTQADLAEAAQAPAQPGARTVRRASRRRGGSTRSGPDKLSHVRVRAKDSLWTIAQRRDVYGSGWLYPLIYKANRALLPDPNHPREGLLLTVPRDVPDPEVEKAEEEAMTGQYLYPPLVVASPTPVLSRPVPTPQAPAVAVAVAVAAPHPNRLWRGFGGMDWALLALLVVLVVVAFLRLNGDDAER